MDMSYTYWQERPATDCERWTLVDPVDGTLVNLATIVRMPGRLTRVYWRASVSPVASGMTDYPDVPTARNAVEAHLAAL